MPDPMADLFYGLGQSLKEYGTLTRRTAPAEDVPETFTRASEAQELGADEMLRTAGVDDIRTEWEKDASGEYTIPLTLLEGQGTNLLPFSEDFDNAAWVKTGATVDSDVGTAPDGTQTADRITATAPDARVAQNYTAGATVHQITCWVKADSASPVDVQLDAGGLGIQTFQATGEWQRFGVEYTGTGAPLPVQIRVVNSGDAVLAWGFQLESSPFPTSYIPTTTSSVTRAADDLSFDWPWAPQAMTIYLRWREGGTALVSGLRYFNLGDNPSGPFLRMRASGGGLELLYNNSQNAQSSFTTTLPVIGDDCEAICVLTAEGRARISTAYNGGAVEAGTLTPALTIPDAWVASTIWPNGSDSNGNARFEILKATRGVLTLEQMRALG